MKGKTVEINSNSELNFQNLAFLTDLTAETLPLESISLPFEIGQNVINIAWYHCPNNLLLIPKANNRKDSKRLHFLTALLLRYNSIYNLILFTWQNGQKLNSFFFNHTPLYYWVLEQPVPANAPTHLELSSRALLNARRAFSSLLSFTKQWPIPKRTSATKIKSSCLVCQTKAFLGFKFF